MLTNWFNAGINENFIFEVGYFPYSMKNFVKNREAKNLTHYFRWS